MKSNRIQLPLFLAVLALTGGGCISHGMILEFNGRTIEVEEMNKATFPRGLEVTYLDGGVMRVNGREAVTVNGKPLTVNESSVTHAGTRHVLGPQQKLVIEKQGRLTIVDQQKAATGGSWWAFWR